MVATIAVGWRPLPGLQPGPAWKPAAHLAGFLAQRYRLVCASSPQRNEALGLDIIRLSAKQMFCSERRGEFERP